MDLDARKSPKKLRQAGVADGRAETADTFDRAEFLRTKQEQIHGSTSLNVPSPCSFKMAVKPMNLYKNPCRIL